MLLADDTNNAQKFFGTVSPPPGVSNYGSVESGGLILFVSNLIKFGTIIAGVIVMFNFIAAGYTYISGSGDSSAANKVREQITMSIIGLLIIVAAYTITAILSLVLFGDAGYILNPKIPGPTP